MQTILKYEVFVNGGEQWFSMPIGGEIIKVATQYPKVGTLCVWVKAPYNVQYESRKFMISGTGHPVQDNAVYVGTGLDDPFVWHLWELP